MNDSLTSNFLKLAAVNARAHYQQTIRNNWKKSYEVPAKIGFDADSPAPLIGVKIALTVE